MCGPLRGALHVGKTRFYRRCVCDVARGRRGRLVMGGEGGEGKQHLPPVAGEGRKEGFGGSEGVRERSTLCFLTNTPSAPWRLLFKNSYFHLHCSNTRQDEIIANPSSNIYA